MFEHNSGLPDAYDRSPQRPTDARLVFVEGAYGQAAELNELQALEARRNRRLGNLITRDGSRIEGADVVVTRATATAATGTVTLAAGRIYVRGDVRDVAAATIGGVAMVGTVRIGVRLIAAVVTAEDDPSLYGLGVGTVSELEPGAARETETLAWAIEGDGGDGLFVPVYTMRDAAIIDQTVAPDLTGVKAVVADYDQDAHGSYIVSGCEVTALGRIDGTQVFSIEKGVANIAGWKRTRAYALRHAETEAPDLEVISAETHPYPATVPAVILLDAPPVAAVATVVIQKRTTETVVRGSVPGGMDPLTHTSVVAIETIVQGGTTYAAATFALAANAVSWAPSGAEPAASSTYQVTYRYNEAVAPDAVTATSITVSGGVVGTSVLVTYTSKLPRRDLLCLTPTGDTAYVKGLSARKGAVAPLCPTTLLKLAEIRNDWLGTPTVVNDGTHSVRFDEQARFNGRVIDILDAFNRLALETDIRGRTTAPKGIFTDPLTDDGYRDQGTAQTAAIVDGCLVLAVDLVATHLFGNAPITLPWVEEIVVDQGVASSSMRINAYANFASMPAELRLEPAVDYWTERVTDWTSATTAEFTVVDDAVPAGTVTSLTTITEVAGERSDVATVLRQIDIQVTIDGFGVGERLESLTFDGIDVRPAVAPLADAAGLIGLTIRIPAGVPTGTRLVRARGAAGSIAEALFVGAGTIAHDTLRQVTLVTRSIQSPVTTIVEVTNVTNNVTNVTNVTQAIVLSAAASGANSADPLAQTFLLSAPRQIIGADIAFAAIGARHHGVRLQLATVAVGVPTSDVLAQAFIGMAAVGLGWTSARFGLPVHVAAIAEHAIVILTDDGEHALSIAALGNVVTAPDGSQSMIAAQPSNVGVLLSSSNRRTWTPHNDADLTHRIVAARYTATERVVVLGTIALDTVSDLVVRGTYETPTEDCSVAFEVVRADGTVISVASDQTIEFGSYVSETVTIRARLKGTATMSPILYPGVAVGLGRIRTSGTYVTKVFAFKAAPSQLNALVAGRLTAGATVTAEWDAADGAWSAMPLLETETLDVGWTEPKWRVPAVTATAGRVRLTLTGGPSSRPALARPRAYTI